MLSAFAAMQGNGTVTSTPFPDRAGADSRLVLAIIFHGDRDTTVNPDNADQVTAQSGQVSAVPQRVERGKVPSGLAHRRIVHTDEDGETVVEQWTAHVSGYACSGCRPVDSYTFPSGPDTTEEIVRHFPAHPPPVTSPQG